MGVLLLVIVLGVGEGQALYFAGETLRKGRQIGVTSFWLWPNKRANETLVTYVTAPLPWLDLEFGGGYFLASPFVTEVDDVLVLGAVRFGFWSPGPLRLGLRVGVHFSPNDIFSNIGIGHVSLAEKGSGLASPIFEPTVGLVLSPRWAVYGAVMGETESNSGERLGIRWRPGNRWELYAESLLTLRWLTWKPRMNVGPWNVGMALRYRL